MPAGRRADRRRRQAAPDRRGARPPWRDVIDVGIHRGQGPRRRRRLRGDPPPRRGRLARARWRRPDDDRLAAREHPGRRAQQRLGCCPRLTGVRRRRRLALDRGDDRLEDAVGGLGGRRSGPSARPARSRAPAGRGRHRPRSPPRRAAAAAPPCRRCPPGTRIAVSGASWWSGSARSSKPASRARCCRWRPASVCLRPALLEALEPASGGAPRGARRCGGSGRCGGRSPGVHPVALEQLEVERERDRDVRRRGPARARDRRRRSGTCRAGRPGTSGCTSRRSRSPSRRSRARRRRGWSRSRPSAASCDPASRRRARRADARCRSTSRRGRRRAAARRGADRARASRRALGTCSPQSAETSTTCAPAAPRDLGDPLAEVPAGADDHRVAGLDEVRDAGLHARRSRSTAAAATSPDSAR